jgi:transcriptional regulator with XRE-family HTH domain
VREEKELEFAVVLRNLRESRGVSQSKLSRLIGVDHSYVSRMEMGQRLPRVEVAKAICEALQLDRTEIHILGVSLGFYLGPKVIDDPLAMRVQSVMSDPQVSEGFKRIVDSVISSLLAEEKFHTYREVQVA